MFVPEDVPSRGFVEKYPNHQQAWVAMNSASAQNLPFTQVYFLNDECRCHGSYNLHKLQGVFD